MMACDDGMVMIVVGVIEVVMTMMRCWVIVTCHQKPGFKGFAAHLGYAYFNRRIRRPFPVLVRGIL